MVEKKKIDAPNEFIRLSKYLLKNRTLHEEDGADEYYKVYDKFISRGYDDNSEWYTRKWIDLETEFLKVHGLLDPRPTEDEISITKSMNFEDCQNLYNQFRNARIDCNMQEIEKTYRLCKAALSYNPMFNRVVLLHKFNNEDFHYSNYCCFSLADEVYKTERAHKMKKSKPIQFYINDVGWGTVIMARKSIDAFIPSFCPFCGECLSKK